MSKDKADRKRRLATIMAADIVAYSRLMDADEEGTYSALLAARNELIEPGIEARGGRIVKHTGDGFLAEFPHVMSAIEFAMSLQEKMGQRMSDVPTDRQIKFRIGVNLGDIIVDDTGDIFGDGVNVAARLEPIGIPGGICISGAVYDSIHKKLDAKFNDLGPQSVKNISTPVRAYDIRWPGEAGKPDERAVKPQKKKSAGLMIGTAAALIAVIGIALWFFIPRGTDQSQIPENSVAVLPFVNQSADPEQEYFSDGIAEELLNILSRVGELRVPARTSTFKFKGQDLDIGEIALQLNVAHVLEGSVRKAGNRVRINAQLIDADTGYQLWSDNFDRELDDIFAVQDEISAAIVVALKEVLGLDETETLPTAHVAASSEAYDQYLLGQHLMHQRTKDSLEQAVVHFQSAIDSDPEYAPAHAGLSIATMLLMDSGSTYGDLSLEEATSRALPAAEQALEIDDKLAEAYAALGFIHYKKQQFGDALTNWDRALMLNPNYAVVYSWRGIILWSLSRYQGALESRKTAAELDPLSPAVLNNYAQALFGQGNHAESTQVLERLKAISPPNYYYTTSWQTYQRGKPADALFALLDGFEIEPESRRIPQGFSNMFGLMNVHDESVRYAANSIRWLPYMWQADFEEMLRIAYEDYEANPGNRYWLSRLGVALLAAGDVEASMTRLEEYVSGFEDGVGPNIEIAGYVALYRQASDDADGTTTILEQLKARYERSVSGGIKDNNVHRLKTMISLLEGSQADALDALDALSHGSGIQPDLEASLRHLTPLVDDPRFDQILSDQAIRWSKQREMLMARICGEETWKEWDPLPGTCNR